MPRYDFNCPGCGCTIEYVTKAPRDLITPVCVCGELMKRVWSSPARAMTHSTPGFHNTDYK